MKILVHSFEPRDIAKDWDRFAVQWQPILGWTLLHEPTGSSLVINKQQAIGLIRLLAQCATLKPNLP